MKYLLIPDKFKGSATAHEVVSALTKGIQSVDKQAYIDAVVASDGGDGFLHTVEAYKEVKRINMESVDAKNRPLWSYYLYDELQHIAYIELANTAGIVKIPYAELSVMNSTTYGVGLQIKDALSKGAKKVFLGLGGSATSDAGIGIAAALGVKFYDESHVLLEPISQNLPKIKHLIIPENLSKNTEFFAVNDVENPLFGTQGAAFVYAPQKGATSSQVLELDRGLQSFDQLLSRVLKKEGAHIPGAGAAGGTAYGLYMFLNASMIQGFDFLTELSGLKNLLEKTQYDYIITGEGKFDEQSLQGKLIDGIMKLTRTNPIPVIVVCGSCSLPPSALEGTPIKTILTLMNDDVDLACCMANTHSLIRESIQDYLTL